MPPYLLLIGQTPGPALFGRASKTRGWSGATLPAKKGVTPLHCIQIQHNVQLEIEPVRHPTLIIIIANTYTPHPIKLRAESCVRGRGSGNKTLHTPAPYQAQVGKGSHGIFLLSQTPSLCTPYTNCEQKKLLLTTSSLLETGRQPRCTVQTGVGVGAGAAKEEHLLNSLNGCYNYVRTSEFVAIGRLHRPVLYQT